MKVLMVVAALAAGAIVAERNMAAAPPPAKSTEVDSRPRIEVVHPRRVTVAQRLQTNATLAAFEEADLFAKVTGYVSDVRVDIGEHVKAGQVLAAIDLPEMQKQLAEDEAQLASKQSALGALLATYTAPPPCSARSDFSGKSPQNSNLPGRRVLSMMQFVYRRLS
jgi:multidrug efflux pump subunit AcrA (membrane-fusion protein)